MLRGVVAEGGTGTSAALRTYELAGKTGTARRVGPGGYEPGRHTAVFAAFFPADEPQLVTVVKLDAPRGSYAAATAAPLTRRMLEQALAARSERLDRGGFAREAAAPSPRSGRRSNGDRPRQLVAWPPAPAADSTTARRVPDVRGLPLREAVGRLHRVGFQVQPIGLGEVVATTPAAGASVAEGTVVTVRTTTRGGR
jgi:cell division protein FtsI (penicillin-binding protein 3)